MALASTVILLIQILTILLSLKKKKKKKGSDPDVGKRVWSDHIFAHACYSDRTMLLYYNLVTSVNLEIYCTAHIGQATYKGEQIDIGDRLINPDTDASTNVAFSDCFSNTQPEGNIAPTDVPGRTPLCYCSKIPHFSRGGKDQPDFPCHHPGIACLYVNQGYMGLNCASIQHFDAILTAVPDTVIRLRLALSEIGVANPDRFLYRVRRTPKVEQIIDLNPVVIMTDVLMDIYPAEAINWRSAGMTARDLVTVYPFMWFSLCVEDTSYDSFFSMMSKIARTYIYPDETGLISFGFFKEGSTSSEYNVIDYDNCQEISLSRPVLSEGSANEFKGTYIAAKLDSNASGGAEGFYNQATLSALNTADVILTGVRRRNDVELGFLHWPDDVKAYLEMLMTEYEKGLLTGSVKTSYKYEHIKVGDPIVIRLPLED